VQGKRRRGTRATFFIFLLEKGGGLGDSSVITGKKKVGLSSLRGEEYLLEEREACHHHEDLAFSLLDSEKKL